jgi:hypothetical protein
MVSEPPSAATFKDNSDLRVSLPLKACVLSTIWQCTSISSLPKGTSPPRAVQKSVTLFDAEYGSKRKESSQYYAEGLVLGLLKGPLYDEVVTCTSQIVEECYR